MPDRRDRFLFLIGLAAYTVGQAVLAWLGPRSQDQTPIDYAHWLLLVGVFLLIPYAARLPRKGIALIASPVLLVGIVGVVGMCVVDLVFWALPAGELERQVFKELRQEPTIWGAFMQVLSNDVFMTGLLLVGLLEYKVSKVATALVIMSSVAILFTPQAFNAPLYAVMIIGFALAFFRYGGARPHGA